MERLRFTGKKAIARVGARSSQGAKRRRSTCETSSHKLPEFWMAEAAMLNPATARNDLRMTRGKNVLLIDDESVIQIVGRRMIEAMGIES